MVILTDAIVTRHKRRNAMIRMRSRLRRFAPRMLGLFIVGLVFAQGLFTPANAQEDGSVCVVWMSDTQHYSYGHPEIWPVMTDWIAQNKETHNIRYVFHTGDVVHTPGAALQWKRAADALRTLRNAEIPYLIAAGNHDISKKTKYANFLYYTGGGYANIGAAYHNGEARCGLFSVEGADFVIAALGFNPKAGATEWVNGVFAQYPERIGILLTHSYINGKGKLTGEGKRTFKNVVKENPNLRLVLCGHKHGAAQISTELDDDGDGTVDRTVHALLSNYQGTQNGGNGYMRLLRFIPGKGLLRVNTYSPLLDDMDYYNTPGKDSFTVPFDYSKPAAKPAASPASPIKSK